MFNNETSVKCPMCNMDKIKNDVNKEIAFNKQKKKEQRLKYGFSGSIESFIKDDCRDKRKTATGYQHKQKTGKNKCL